MKYLLVYFVWDMAKNKSILVHNYEAEHIIWTRFLAYPLIVRKVCVPANWKKPPLTPATNFCGGKKQKAIVDIL